MNNGKIDPRTSVVISEDGKPDTLATIIALLQNFREALGRIEKLELTVGYLENLANKPAPTLAPTPPPTPPPTGPDGFAMNSNEFDKHIAGQEQAAINDKAKASAGIKEFWYKNATGKNVTVKFDINNLTCPICHKGMGDPRTDKFGKPSLYCTQCRLYFNWSKYNDTPRAEKTRVENKRNHQW